MKKGKKAESLKLFVPITKYDEERHVAYGVIAAEELDKSGEILDFKASLPHFQAWSDEMKAASGGKNVGNLRVMHGDKVAGRGIAFTPNAEQKRFEMGFKIEDPVEQQLTASGCYTGFSIGGKYVSRDDDPVMKQEDGKTPAKRYVAAPVEVSLVDNPCGPSARFEYFKADGSTELRKFITVKADREAVVRKVLASVQLRKQGDADGLSTDAQALAEGVRRLLARFALISDSDPWTLSSLTQLVGELEMIVGDATRVEAEQIASGEPVGEEPAGEPDAAGGEEPVAASASADVTKQTDDEETEETDDAPPDETEEEKKKRLQAEAEAEMKESGIVSVLRKVHKAIAEQGSELARMSKTADERIQKSVTDAVTKATGELKDAIDGLAKRVEVVEATPAEAGRPVKRAEKVIGTDTQGAGKADPTAMIKATIGKLRSEGKLTSDQAREVTLQFASQLMPK